jgi:acetyl-CoA carboxylase biotin carboxyl carrier protein
MKKNSISEFELEKQEFKIKLKRGGGQALQLEEYSGGQALMVPGTTQAMTVAAQAGGAAPAAVNTDPEVKSPMIGTFYRAPSPESDNYVELGAEVNPDTVVCLIEAMKVMNEIKAEVKGVVSEILVENAKPVEFGQPMFRIRPT